MAILAQMLDIRTLAFYTVFVYVLFGVVLLSYSLIERRFKGITFIGIADFLAGGGLLLVSLRDYVPPFLSILAANGLLLASLMLNYEGIRIFLGKGRQFVAPIIVCLVVSVFAFSYFTLVRDSVGARVVIVCLTSIIMCALTSWLLLRNAPPELIVPLSVTASAFFLYGVFCIIRALWVINEPPLDSLFHGGIIHGLTFFVASILVAVNGLGILWVADARLGSELLRQARIDSLTGLDNRRALDEIAEREVSRSLRSGSPLSFIMADIDFFKRINDRFGHKTGDMALAAVASLMSRSLRKQDILARYGGEEFVAILPDTEKAQAVLAAEKLRAAFGNEVFACGGEKITLSLSFGISSMGEDGATVDELIDRADDALYEAKQGGRNKVVALGLG